MVRNILDEIVASKRVEVDRAQRNVPLADVRAMANSADPPRDFRRAVTRPTPGGIHLIAEIKRRSPSAGVIREDLDPVAIGHLYHESGASAISVLTDEKYFDGRLEFIGQVRQVVPLPVLRKDFVLAAYQVWQARAAGADAVLLIAEVLGPQKVAELAALCGELGMAALVEGHQPEMLERVLATLGDPLPRHILIGINNRDLTVQKTDLATTERLARRLKDTSRLVAESGIKTREDVLFVKHAGAQAILVGEGILAAPDMAAKIRELLGSDI